MIENSIVYGFLSKIGNFILSLIQNSALGRIFLTPNENVSESRGSIFFKTYRLVRGVLWKIFDTLKITKLFEGSIFKMVFLWTTFAVVLAPIAPTMVIILFALAVLFSIVTLPVEFNASSRAVNMLGNYGILSSDELEPVRKVLGAAALTYVAAAVSAILSLLRLILIFGRRDDR